jgi:hypothetical protein
MNLEKNIWTEQDFESMGWHDSKIYGIAFEEKSEFVLDIDYIFMWIKPTEDQQAFKFWVSPCTLVFENVYNLNLDIEMSEPFEIQISDVSRNNPQRPKNADFIHRDIEYDWKMETNNGEISFTSIGYKQYVRELPKLLDSQTIGKEDRNGISFERIKK